MNIGQKFTPREQKYSTVEKECLVILWVDVALRYYFLGRSITLCSDRMKDTSARITVWYLALQLPFNFKVIHRLGAQMVVADVLSFPVWGGGGELIIVPGGEGIWGGVG